jgi:WD40 repeat protein
MNTGDADAGKGDRRRFGGRVAARPVFVSYASADRDAAEAIREAVERRGIPCWMAPRDVPPGAVFGEAIVDAIEAAKVMLLVFSRAANNSEAIKRELVLAGDARIDVIPLMIEKVAPSGHFRYELATRQWIDLFSAWDAEMARLVAHLTQLVGGGTEPSAPADVAVPAVAPTGRKVPTDPLSEKREIRRSPVRRRVLLTGGGVAAGAAVVGYALFRMSGSDPFAGTNLTAGIAALGHVYGIAVSPDGMLLATAHETRIAALWELASGRLIRRFAGHANAVRAVAFAPDGRALATGSADKTARLWDSATGHEAHRLEGHSGVVHAVAFMPDVRALATGSWDNTARLWDTATGQEMRRFEGHSDTVLAVAFAPDGRALATGSDDKTARLWDTATGHEMRRFAGHMDTVNAVAFAPDGRALATGARDMTARLWDSATGHEMRQFTGHSNGVVAIAFVPDGRALVTGSNDKTARLWDPATGREMRRFEGHSGGVLSVACARDGRTLATGSGDTTARLWDIATGRETHRLEGHSSAVYAVDFAPAGQTLATASTDGTIRLWDVRSGRELARIHHTDDATRLVVYGDGRSYLGSDGIETFLSLVQGLEAKPVPDAYRARYFGVKTLAEVRRLLGVAEA